MTSTPRRTLADAVRRPAPAALIEGVPDRSPTSLAAAPADLSAPRKQRHTARRIWQRLVDERGASVAESTVRACVGRVRRELAA